MTSGLSILSGIAIQDFGAGRYCPWSWPVLLCTVYCPYLTYGWRFQNNVTVGSEVLPRKYPLVALGFELKLYNHERHLSVPIQSFQDSFIRCVIAKDLLALGVALTTLRRHTCTWISHCSGGTIVMTSRSARNAIKCR